MVREGRPSAPGRSAACHTPLPPPAWLAAEAAGDRPSRGASVRQHISLISIHTLLFFISSLLFFLSFFSPRSASSRVIPARSVCVFSYYYFLSLESFFSFRAGHFHFFPRSNIFLEYLRKEGIGIDRVDRNQPGKEEKRLRKQSVKMVSLKALVVASVAAVASAQQTIKILAVQDLTLPDTFTFKPHTLTANVNDILEFHFAPTGFLPSNHTVAQGTFDAGCKPMPGGWFSGNVTAVPDTPLGEAVSLPLLR